MDNSAQSNPGLLGSARLLLASLLEIGHTRLQLASTELEEERLRVTELLIYACAALFFIGMGLVLASMLIVVLFWDSHRVLVMGVLTGVYLGVGIAAALIGRHKAARKPPLLAATLEELRRDRAALSAVERPTAPR